MDKTAAYFNMDMVGLGDRIDAPGALNFPSIFEVIMRDQDPEIAKKIDPSMDGPGGSDYSAFMEKGIEALALMTSGRGGHPDYHDSGDDPAKIEADILGWTGQFVLQGMLSVANETKATLLIQDRLAIYQSQRFAPPDAFSGGGWPYVKATTRDELLGLLAQRVRDLQAAAQGGAVAGGGRGGRGGGGGRVATGVRGAGVFQGSVALLETTAPALNFGRIDVAGPDGAWFGDKVSPDGKDALDRDGGGRHRRQPRPAVGGAARRRARQREEADHGDRSAGHGCGAARQVQEEQRAGRRSIATPPMSTAASVS